MSIELLKQNVQKEKVIAKKLFDLNNRLKYVRDKKQLEKLNQAIFSYLRQIKILNKSIPKLLKDISFAKKLSDEDNKKSSLVNVSYDVGGGSELVTIDKGDKNKYLEELKITKDSLKSLGDEDGSGKEFENNFKKPSVYVRLSNRFFGKNAKNLMSRGWFKKLGRDLKEGGFVFLTRSYISVMFLTTTISFFISILFAVGLFLFTFSFHSFWILLLPVLVYVSMIYYPSSEAENRGVNIDLELPFATIQMSAISSADIEPSNIFRIIALSKEYKYVSKEAKKIMNQINLYGYDFVTSLKNIARSSPSKEWAELLNGISTTIRSGGDLSKYLDKKAESFLFDYRLDQEKATKSAETFMDIYIAVVIAAPLLLMLLLVLMNVSNIGLPLGVFAISLIMITLVTIINMIFLLVLYLKQKGGDIR